MTYAVRVTFQEFAQTGTRKGKCPVCGKAGRRSQQFTMTENPWNKNSDGSVRTPQEIRRALQDQAVTYSAGQFMHAKCENEQKENPTA